MDRIITLQIKENQDKTGGLVLFTDGAAAYTSISPAILHIKELNGQLKTYQSGYNEWERTDHKWICRAQINTVHGSCFLFCDEYSVNDAKALIHFDRKVLVLKADSRDAGFSTEFMVKEADPGMIEDYEFFIPGVWYGKNEHVVPHAFGGDPYARCSLIRATRMALPYVQMYRPGTGRSLSLLHTGPEPDTGQKEESAGWLVDGAFQYSSLGMRKVPEPAVSYQFPGSEGEGNYIDAASIWARRSHPLTGDPRHAYNICLHFQEAPDKQESMKREWRFQYDLAHPEVKAADMERNYQIGVELLDTYSQEYNGVMGIPFWAEVPEGTVCDISFQMGFVGQQLQCAYQLLKYGIENERPQMIEKARKTADFWAERSMENSVIPRVWYNAFPDTFREDYPTYTRTVADGMEGMLNIWQLARRRHIEKPEWFGFCRTYGRWLAANQNPDGSFYRSYNEKGEPVHKGKFNTSNVIRFLLQMYLETEEKCYLETAVKAGEYCYEHIYRSMCYVGGTADNDNTTDKEAGMIALYAFLSLYEVDGKEKWLKAACCAADFIETWTYCWTYPVYPHKGNMVFDKVDFTGLSLIATGHSHCDVMMAYMFFDFYKLYRYTGDRHYYDFARFLEGNTKQTTDWTGELGHIYPGLLEESGELAMQYYNGLGRWLPWCTIAQIEPLTRMKEWFGVMDLEQAEEMMEGLTAEEQKKRLLPDKSFWIKEN